MNIHSAEIKDFKNIPSAEFVSLGRNILLRGMNGTGKTSILEAILTALLGKDALPDDPVRHGQESAKITVNLGSGTELTYTIAVTISKAGDFALRLTTYDAQGRKLTVSKPQQLLKDILFRQALDPHQFFSLSDRDQLKMLYDILPDLKAQLDTIDGEYKALQDDRSEIRRTGDAAKLDLGRATFTPGLPAEPVDPAQLLAQLDTAQAHNAHQDEMAADLAGAETNARRLQERMDASEKAMRRTEEMIAQLARQLSEQKAELLADIARTNVELETVTKIRAQIAAFQPMEVEPIREALESANSTNDKIARNAHHRTLSARVDKLAEEYSAKLRAMKDCEYRRAQVIASAKMPIEHLSVGDGCLLYPDPRSGELVRVNSLSTGQKWPVVLKILAALLPEYGLRMMVVKNRHDLDSVNMEALYRAAAEVSVQLVMHETERDGENSEFCEILIEDSVAA